MSQLTDADNSRHFIVRKSSMFMFALLIYPYVILSANLFNIRLGPANFQITAIMLFFVLCAFMRAPLVLGSFNWKIIAVLALGFIFIPFKMLAGKLYPSDLQGMRLFYILPLLWSLYKVYAPTEETKNKIVNIIIWSCLFIAVFGIIHFFFFPKVFLSQTLTEEFMAGNIDRIPGHSQEAAFFGNSSAYGCILVAGMMGIYLAKKKSLLYKIIFIVLLLGVFLSVSRWATLFALIVLAMYLKNNLKLNIRNLLQLLAVSVLAVFILLKFSFFTLTAKYAYEKWNLTAIFSGSSIKEHRLYAGRFPGYAVATKILCGDPSHFFFGGGHLEEFRIGDVHFSDNSFIFLAIGFGVPLALLWTFVVLFKLVPLLMKNWTQIIMTVFFYGTIFSTPALLWDSWLVYILGIMHYAAKNTDNISTENTSLPPAQVGNIKGS